MGLYENIKNLCDQNKIAVTRLESELGFSRGSIGKIRQHKSMTAVRLDKIADYFGVSVDYLMTGEQPTDYYLNPETAQIAQEIFDNPELHTLFDSARDASPDDLKTVQLMLEALKAKEGHNDPA